MSYCLFYVWSYRLSRRDVSGAACAVAHLYKRLASSKESKWALRVNPKHSVEITYSALVFFFVIEEEPAIIEGGEVVRFQPDRIVVVR